MPSPNTPSVLRPQHFAAPPWKVAHVVVPPAWTETTLPSPFALPRLRAGVRAISPSLSPPACSCCGVGAWQSVRRHESSAGRSARRPGCRRARRSHASFGGMKLPDCEFGAGGG